MPAAPSAATRGGSPAPSRSNPPPQKEKDKGDTSFKSDGGLTDDDSYAKPKAARRLSKVVDDTFQTETLAEQKKLSRFLQRASNFAGRSGSILGRTGSILGRRSSGAASQRSTKSAALSTASGERRRSSLFGVLRRKSSIFSRRRSSARWPRRPLGPVKPAPLVGRAARIAPHIFTSSKGKLPETRGSVPEERRESSGGRRGSVPTGAATQRRGSVGSQRRVSAGASKDAHGDGAVGRPLGKVGRVASQSFADTLYMNFRVVDQGDSFRKLQSEKRMSEEERRSVNDDRRSGVFDDQENNMLYPMYIMRISDFLERYGDGSRRLEPHQYLRRKGLVRPIGGPGDVLFISHQWAGFDHCDPEGEQTLALCTFLRRLVSGQITSLHEAVGVECIGCGGSSPGTDSARAWLGRVDAETSSIWLDYVCVPQPYADLGPDDDDEAAAAPAKPAQGAQVGPASTPSPANKRRVSFGAIPKEAGLAANLPEGYGADAPAPSAALAPTPPPSPSSSSSQALDVQTRTSGSSSNGTAPVDEEEQGVSLPEQADLPSERFSFQDARLRSAVTSGSPDQQDASPLPRLRKKTKEQKQAEQELDLAVTSIPAYIDRSSVIIILAPPCRRPHSGLLDKLRAPEINFASWRSRGWCRLERMGAFLSTSPKCCIVVRSAQGQPTLQPLADVMNIVPGEGDFTCCALNHRVAGAPITCDKTKIEPVLATMLDKKMHTHLLRRDLVQYRFFAALRHHFLRGLREHSFHKPPDEAASEQEALLKLKARLRWRGPPDVAFGKRSGWTLLRYAVMNDNIMALRAILGAADSASERRALLGARLVRAVPGAAKGSTALHTAARWAGTEMVQELLQAGANPYAVDQMRGFTPLHWACNSWGQPSVVAHLVDECPVKLEQLDKREAGMSALHWALAFTPHPHKRTVVEALLDGGAQLSMRSASGRTALHSLCLSDDCNDALLTNLLAKARAADTEPTVDARCEPRTLAWRTVMVLSRLLYRTGMSRSTWISHLAFMSRSTALHCAARRGDTATVRTLIDAGADVHACNAIGMDALKVSHKWGPFPTVEAQLLDAIASVRSASLDAADGAPRRSSMWALARKATLRRSGARHPAQRSRQVVVEQMASDPKTQMRGTAHR